MMNTDYCHLLVWRVIVLTQVQNVHASWLLTVVFVVYFGPETGTVSRHHNWFSINAVFFSLLIVL